MDSLKISFLTFLVAALEQSASELWWLQSKDLITRLYDNIRRCFELAWMFENGWKYVEKKILTSSWLSASGASVTTPGVMKLGKLVLNTCEIMLKKFQPIRTSPWPASRRSNRWIWKNQLFMFYSFFHWWLQSSVLEVKVASLCLILIVNLKPVRAQSELWFASYSHRNLANSDLLDNRWRGYLWSWWTHLRTRITKHFKEAFGGNRIWIGCSCEQLRCSTRQIHQKHSFQLTRWWLHSSVIIINKESHNWLLAIILRQLWAR